MLALPLLPRPEPLLTPASRRHPQVVSEIMAVLALTTDLPDMRERLGRMVRNIRHVWAAACLVRTRGTRTHFGVIVCRSSATTSMASPSQRTTWAVVAHSRC